MTRTDTNKQIIIPYLDRYFQLPVVKKVVSKDRAACAAEVWHDKTLTRLINVLEHFEVDLSNTKFLFEGLKGLNLYFLQPQRFIRIFMELGDFDEWMIWTGSFKEDWKLTEIPKFDDFDKVEVGYMLYLGQCDDLGCDENHRLKFWTDNRSIETAEEIKDFIDAVKKEFFPAMLKKKTKVCL